MNSIFSFACLKKFLGVCNVGRGKFRRMTTLLSGKVRTVFGFDPTDSREGDTSFLDNLGLREFRMKQREHKKDLSRRNSLHGEERQFVDLKLSSINLIYMLSNSGHMILFISFNVLQDHMTEK